MENSKGKIKGNDLYLKMLLLFPIFTLFQSFSGLGWLNRILFMLTVLVQMVLQFKKARLKRNWFFVLSILLLTHIYALFQTQFPLYNENLLFYFFFWTILAMYFSSTVNETDALLQNNIPFIKRIIWIWSLIVGISILISSSYMRNNAWGGSSYFVSITGSTFRLAPTALMISTLVTVYFCYTKNKKSIVYMIIPLYCFLMCGSRTYLGVGALVILLYWYLYTTNTKKLYFWLTLAPVAVLFVYLVMNTAAMDKILATTFTSNSYFDYWGTITNGRSIFWRLDLQQFFKQNIMNKLLGCGFNYSYVVTEQFYTSAHWAHNDFIEVLLNFGFTGLGLYLYTVFVLLKSYISKEHFSITIIALCILIWFLNAFFNMFYTYTCSMVCYPLMLAAVKHYYVGKKQTSDSSKIYS